MKAELLSLKLAIFSQWEVGEVRGASLPWVLLVKAWLKMLWNLSGCHVLCVCDSCAVPTWTQWWIINTFLILFHGAQHSQLLFILWCWGWNPEPQACSASSLPRNYISSALALFWCWGPIVSFSWSPSDNIIHSKGFISGMAKAIYSG